MPLINVIIVLVVVGVLLYVVETLVPIDRTDQTHHSHHRHSRGLHLVAASIWNHWALGIVSVQIGTRIAATGAGPEVSRVVVRNGSATGELRWIGRVTCGTM